MSLYATGFLGKEIAKSIKQAIAAPMVKIMKPYKHELENIAKQAKNAAKESLKQLVEGMGFSKLTKKQKLFRGMKQGFTALAKSPVNVFTGLMSFANSLGVLEPLITVINALMELFVGQVMTALMPVFQLLIDQLTSPTMMSLIEMLANLFAVVLAPALAIVAGILEALMAVLGPFMPMIEEFGKIISAIIAPIAAFVASAVGKIFIIVIWMIGIAIGAVAMGIAWIIDTITFLLSWIPGIEATHSYGEVAGFVGGFTQGMANAYTSFDSGGAYLGAGALPAQIHKNEMVIDIDEAKAMVNEGSGNKADILRLQSEMEHMNESLDYLVYNKKMKGL